MKPKSSRSMPPGTPEVSEFAFDHRRNARLSPMGQWCRAQRRADARMLRRATAAAA